MDRDNGEVEKSVNIRRTGQRALGEQKRGKPGQNVPVKTLPLGLCLLILVLLVLPASAPAAEPVPAKEADSAGITGETDDADAIVVVEEKSETDSDGVAEEAGDADTSVAVGEKGEANPDGDVEDEGGAEEEFVEDKGIADPLEKWNRAIYTVNDRLYFWVMKPVAKGYNKVMPEWGRIRVRNVFRNAETPIRFVNCLLQLKLHEAVKEVGRFIVNTTAGIGGMFDILADNPDAQMSDRDLGQTLGKYGVGNGFFIIWPFLGPSSLRDTVGLVGDGFVDPINYLPTWGEVIAVDAYKEENDVSLRLGEYEDFKESSVDPYVAMRNAYYQHRKSKLEE
jgi:phospholipid-binding lipoprotein MlaA